VARTDDDTWDLASSVGATATMVAAQRVLAHREGLIDDPYAEPLVRAVGLEFMIRALDGDIIFEDIDPIFTVRLAAEAMAVRTRHFDKSFLDAVEAGVRQAVILAAGLDARAYRLPWPDGTVVYEMDQPEVIEFKTTTLAGLGAEPEATHRLVAIDLREDWPKALKDNGFDPQQPTAWIAEGLLIYLPPEAQDKLFDTISELSAPGSRLATERVPDVTDFINGRPKQLAAKMKELGSDISMEDLIYQGQRTNVVEYLQKLGWSVTEQNSADAHAANGFKLPDNDVTQRFGKLSYVSAVLWHAAS
jgi:methyltransferase (TIGR00027 family)